MSSEERQATIMKWGLGALIVTCLILFVVFVIVPAFKKKSREEDKKEVTLSGGNILGAELPSGGKSSEPYTMYKREFYTAISDPDAVTEAIENNKFIHLSITFTIPDNFNLSEYFKIKRTLPNPQNNRTVIDYVILNDSNFDTNNTVSSGMTIHRGDVDAKDIINDPNTGRITQASEFFKEESVEGETFIVFMWGESCGDTLQTSGLDENDQNSKNVIELFGKIHPKHYGTSGDSSTTEEIPIRNINLEPLRGEVLMPDSLYSRNLTTIDSSVVDIQMVGANNIELEKLTSEIIADDVKFYLGFKQSGQGRIDHNQWLKIPETNPSTGTFSARSLYSSGNKDESAMDYFDSDQTPVFTFKNIDSGDRTKFKIAFERGGTTYYVTHDVTADDRNNTQRKLKFTNVEADGKFFNLIETPKTSVTEGSFKLVLDDFNNGSNDRFVLCLDENLAIDSFNTNLQNAIKIIHSSAITPVQALRQFAVYCPIVTNLAEDNKIFNLHILDNGPHTSENFSTFFTKDSSEGHVTSSDNNKRDNRFGNVTVLDKTTTTAYQIISGFNETNENGRLKFDQYSSGSHTYKLRSTSSRPKYLVGKNNRIPQLDDIYFSTRENDAAEVLVVGYPTTAALGISLKKEQNRIHCMVLYRRPGLEYRPLHHPNNKRLNPNSKGNYETRRAKGGINIQVLLKQVSS